MNTFSGKLAVQQRVLPTYRVPFFDTLAGRCAGGLQLFAGKPRREEAIDTADHLQYGRLVPTKNIHIFSGALYFCHQEGFVDWLRDFDPDTLIVEANPRYLATPAAIRWMHGKHRPVLGWGLGCPPLHGVERLMRETSRRNFLRGLDGVIAYSQQGAVEYAACGVPESRIFIAPNAAAIRPSGEAPIRPARWEGRPKILFVGRLQARKRLDLLFQACSALPEQLHPELTIVGDGPDRDMIEGEARRVFPETIFTGSKTGNELIGFFQKADLFVLPGTGGLAIQQALAYALPVIVGEGDGSQGQLVRPGNGWLVRPGDAGELTTALAEALSDPSRLRQMGQESFRIARDEVNIERMVEVFIHAVNSVAGK